MFSIKQPIMQTDTSDTKRLKADPDEEKELEYSIQVLNKMVIKYLPRWIRRGDVVHFASLESYRNAGKWIWNGNTLVTLDYHSADDYGIIPAEFLINEFGSIHYFADVVDHNSCIWMDLSDFDYVSQSTSTQFGCIVHKLVNRKTLKNLIVYATDNELDMSVKLWSVPSLYIISQRIK